MKGGFFNKAAWRNVSVDAVNRSGSSSSQVVSQPTAITLPTVEPLPSSRKMRSGKSEVFETHSKVCWEGHEPVSHKPTAGDILVTLDAENFAEIGLWDESVVPQQLMSSKRGAWLVVVHDLRVELTGGQLLPAGWGKRCRCLMTFKLSASGFWMSDQNPEPLFPVILEEGGLGCGQNSEPSSQNIFVIMHTNNFPQMPPILQAAWWRPKFDTLFTPNAWVLGVVDSRFTVGLQLRSLTVWTRGSGLEWTRSGECHKSFIPEPAVTDRVELGPPVPVEVTMAPPQAPAKPSPCRMSPRPAETLDPSLTVLPGCTSTQTCGILGNTCEPGHFVPSETADAQTAAIETSLLSGSSNSAFTSQ